MLRVAFAVVLLGSASIAAATRPEPPAKEQYFTCWANYYSSSYFSDENFRVRLVNDVQFAFATRKEASAFWNAYAEKQQPGLILGGAYCDEFWESKHASYRHSKLMDAKARPVSVSFATLKSASIAKPESSKTPAPGTAQSGSMPSKADETARAEAERAKAKAEREAEWQAKLDKFAADKKAWEDKIASQKAEERRKQAAHSAAQEAAARQKAAYEAKMANFRRIMEDQEERQRRYQAALEQNRRCAAGNQQACDDIKAGRLDVPAKQMAEKDEPKTSDDDARSCVSSPVVAPTSTKGQIAATVVNGCRAAVDVRICLLREGGWNCGVTWGLAPQGRWSHSSFRSNGEIFWDARIRGSDRPLANP